MTRAARSAVVIVTSCPDSPRAEWLIADFLPEVARMDRRIFPSPDVVAGWLGGQTVVESMPVARDTADWMLGSCWASPERVLVQSARDATSGWSHDRQG